MHVRTCLYVLESTGMFRRHGLQVVDVGDRRWLRLDVGDRLAGEFWVKIDSNC